MKTPIQIFHVTPGYRMFCRPWWACVLSYPFRQFWRDLYEAYHRMRYGWAPRDIWNLDAYLDQVLADTLAHLADTTHGTPGGYPYKKNHPVDDRGHIVTDHKQWEQDLRRWSAVFRECANEDALDEYLASGWQQRETKTERRARVLNEMSYWWGALWD